MTWEPKNKTDDDDEAALSDCDDKDKDDCDQDKDPRIPKGTISLGKHLYYSFQTILFYGSIVRQINDILLDRCSNKKKWANLISDSKITMNLESEMIGSKVYLFIIL